MKIAFLGTGLMGGPIAGRLQQAGHALTVYNRDREKTRDLVRAGAVGADSPAAALNENEWVVAMLADAPALEQTLLSPSALPRLDGRRVINMATIAPAEARAIGERVSDAGGEFMECPVLGSIPEAEQGTLILMFGGSPLQFEAAAPLLGAVGSAPVHVGELGKASALKLAMNQLIASLTAGFAASLGLIRREGVDVDTFMAVLRESALYAPTFDKKLPRMLARNFAQPNFPVKHLLKDTRLFAAAADGAGVDTAVVAAVQGILERAEASGRGELDYSALYELADPAD